jgi:hypothetical protein
MRMITALRYGVSFFRHLVSPSPNLSALLFISPSPCHPISPSFFPISSAPHLLISLSPLHSFVSLPIRFPQFLYFSSQELSIPQLVLRSGSLWRRRTLWNQREQNMLAGVAKLPRRMDPQFAVRIIYPP